MSKGGARKLSQTIRCDACGKEYNERKMRDRPCPCGCWSGVMLDSIRDDPPRPLTEAEAEAERLRDALEGTASLACDLLASLQPWGIHEPGVRSAATRLTVALAALPLPERRDG